MFKIFLDDIRNAPDDTWVVVRSADCAWELFRALHAANHDVLLSLDHDLGENTATGYDLVCWIESALARKNLRYAPEMLVHSANPVGAANIAAAIRQIHVLAELRS